MPYLTENGKSDKMLHVPSGWTAASTPSHVRWRMASAASRAADAKLTLFIFAPGLILCVCEQGFGNKALLLVDGEFALLFGVSIVDLLLVGSKRTKK